MIILKCCQRVYNIHDVIWIYNLLKETFVYLLYTLKNNRKLQGSELNFFAMLYLLVKIKLRFKEC